ncbi:MAG: hypothetical protein QN203_11800, partial [Armatimonadota bacterium]|nr:hypothetical protein [Armatimonadota bacterium]
MALLAAPKARSAALTGQVQASAHFMYDPSSGRGALIGDRAQAQGHQEQTQENAEVHRRPPRLTLW